LNENDLYVQLREANIKISQSDLSAILASSFIDTYNPFNNYFNSLPQWDQKTDYIEQLASYLKTDNDDFFRLHFKKMLVRTVACALDNNYFNKQVFVLIGQEQNTDKSSFIRNLVPKNLEEYYTENINPDGDKDDNL